MKAKEDCLKNKMTMQSQGGGLPITWYTKQDVLNAMDEYAVQFMNITPCHACNGTGIGVGITSCMNCSGQGKIVLMPIITTTAT